MHACELANLLFGVCCVLPVAQIYKTPRCGGDEAKCWQTFAAHWADAVHSWPGALGNSGVGGLCGVVRQLLCWGRYIDKWNPVLKQQGKLSCAELCWLCRCCSWWARGSRQSWAGGFLHCCTLIFLCWAKYSDKSSPHATRIARVC